MNRTCILGLTGGIGAGKSYIAALLKEHYGIATYDCDREAKRLNEESEEIRKALTKLVGDTVYDAGGRLQRPILAGYLFASQEHAQQVNAIIHPVVRQDFERWKEYQGKDAGAERKIVVLESAILFESGFNQLCDKTIAVCAPMELRIERACRRDGCSAEAVRQRIQRQTSDEERTRRADFVITNDENNKELLNNIENIIKNL